MSDARQQPTTSYHELSRPEVQALVSPDSRKILDVGCAAGALGAQLKERQGAEVWGVEIVEDVARQAEKRLDRVIIGSIEDVLSLLPDQYFDTIIFADVLEHLADPYSVVKRVKTKLNRSGEIVASIPNVRHWSVVKELLEGRWDYLDAGILDRTHLRFFTKKSVTELFLNAGYSITEMQATTLQGTYIPKETLKALARANLDVSTLEEESAHYQYLIRTQLKTAQDALVSIIMLTHNELDHTVKCLASIEACTPQPHELIIVDNGSTDGTVEHLRRYLAEHDQVRVVANESNRGFAAGNNQGLSLARGEYVLLLNNDTLVTPGWLERMLSVFERHPEVGIVGPMANYVSGPQLVPDVPYRTAAELEAFAEKWAADHADQSMPITRVVGFCLLARKAVVEQIGGLDEQFGSGNFEDDDFCIRAALSGFQARVAKDSFIHHTGSQTFKGAKIDYHQSMLRNWGLFKTKWGIPADVPMEQGYTLEPRPWEASRHYVSLPDVSVDHRHEAGQRWWHEVASEEQRPRVWLGFIREDPDIADAQALVHRFAEDPAPLPVWPDAATVNAQLGEADYLVLMAPDVLVTKGWLEALLAVADAEASIAATGPTSNEAPPPQKTKRGYQSLKKELQKFAARRARNNRGVWDAVPHLGAFCLLLNTQAVKEVGGLNERRPLAEALWELYRRLQAEGFTVACARGVYVHHEALTDDEWVRHDEPTRAAHTPHEVATTEPS